MGMFEDVDEETRKQLEDRKSKRGSISKPLVDEFIESGKEMVKVSFEESGSKSITSLYLSLKNYMKTHPDVDVEIFMHQGEVYLKTVKEE